MTRNLPEVSIVIPTYNEQEFIGRCLTSLMSINYPSGLLEIILVDNGSTDNTLKIASGYPITILEKKDGYVGAVRNYGASHSKGEILVFLDSDCIVEPTWILNGIKKITESESAVFGGQYLLREDPSWLEKYWILSDKGNIIHQTTLVGGCIFIQKSIFNKVGGFDESLSSGEDSKLTTDLRAGGSFVIIDPTLSVIHLGYPATIFKFVKRQIWHSADYVSKFPGSLNDKVFLLIIMFLSSMTLLFISIINGSLFWTLGLAGSLTVPGILSIKRIIRSKFSVGNPGKLSTIYFVDILYVIGRSIGVIFGLKRALVFHKSETK